MATYEIKISVNSIFEQEEKARTTARTVAGESVETENGKQAVKKSTITGLAAFDYAKNFARQAVHHEIGLIETRTGQAKRQQQIEFAVGIMDRLADIGEGALTGGVFAGGIGAAVGAAATVVKQGVQLYQASDTLNVNKSVEKVNIFLNQSRIYSEGNR